MYVDPAVSRAKFEREVADFKRLADAYQRRGIFLIDAIFPKAFAIFAAINAQPVPMLPFGVVLDFSDYDVAPPSVQVVNPFTRAKLKYSEIGYKFKRLLPTPTGTPTGTQPMQHVDLLQAFADERPFICLQGVKEYHESPAHTGDSWFLHRGTGVGTLAFLLDILSQYGAAPIAGPGISVQFLMNGINVSAIPR